MWVLSTHLVLSPKRKWIYTINSNKYLISCLSPPSGSKLELIVHQPGPQSPMGGQCSLATVTIQGQNCYWSLESFSLFNVGTRKCWHHFKFIFSLFYIYILYIFNFETQSSWPRTCHMGQIGLGFTKIYPSLLPECWHKGVCHHAWLGFLYKEATVLLSSRK